MIYIGITAIIFIGDLLIKNHMETALKDNEEKRYLNGFLRFRMHHNRGAFLNAGQKKRPLVAILSLVLTIAVTALFIMTLGTRGNNLLKAGLSLLLGGAFSNTYDRLKRKYVVDYVSFGTKGKGFSNIVFNLSDFGIIIGAWMAALSVGQGK